MPVSVATVWWKRRGRSGRGPDVPSNRACEELGAQAAECRAVDDPDDPDDPGGLGYLGHRPTQNTRPLETSSSSPQTGELEP
jgi:hypothetical protein